MILFSMAELDLLLIHLSIVNLVCSSFYKAKIDTTLFFCIKCLQVDNWMRKLWASVWIIGETIKCEAHDSFKYSHFR
jgi:hypothetical protein